MIAFLLVATALVILPVLALILPPLLRPPVENAPVAAEDTQRETSLAILREERAQLEEDHARGELSDAAYAAAQEELAARALHEATAEPAAAQPAPAPRRAAALALFIGCALPVLAIALYFVLGLPAALRDAPSAPESGLASAPEIDREDFARRIETLTTLIESDQLNDDVDTAWVMLARGLAILNDRSAVEQTWQRISGKIPQTSLDPILTWADLLAATRQGHFEGDPDRLLTLAFQLAPQDAGVLSLMGIRAYSREQYAEAADYWQRLLAILPAEDGARARLLESIQDARSRAKLPPLSANDAPAAQP